MIYLDVYPLLHDVQRTNRGYIYILDISPYTTYSGLTEDILDISPYTTYSGLTEDILDISPYTTYSGLTERSVSHAYTYVQWTNRVIYLDISPYTTVQRVTE